MELAEFRRDEVDSEDDISFDFDVPDDWDDSVLPFFEPSFDPPLIIDGPMILNATGEGKGRITL